jgi:Protein of unknown function (DUF4232)
MAGRRAAAGLGLATLALTAAGCLGGGTKTVTLTRTQTVTSTRTVTTTGSVTSAKPCAGTDLAATFSLVPGSAGAGQIAYTLTVKNTSPGPCSVHGIPQGTLLGSSGTALPTRVKSAGGGPRLVLPPGASATAQARFSPDVAGDGDSQSGECQPQAHTFQLSTDGGGVTEAGIKPPTSVCEQGTLHFDAFAYAG